MNNKDLIIREKLQKDKQISDKADKIFNNFKEEFKLENNEGKKVIKISLKSFIAIAASVLIVGFLGVNLYVQKIGKPSIYSMIDDANKKSYEEKINISKIEITKEPTKKVYKAGENFDKAGMVVVATYSDGSKKEIMDYKVANGEDLEVGQKSVLIHYTDGDREIEAYQPITVTQINMNMSKIEITKEPTKKVYKAGENFDKAGMVVVATYSDGSKKEIMDYKVANGEDLEVGQKSVLIHYTDGDREIEAYQPITVTQINMNMSKIEITKEPTKKVYKAGENFDKAGMVVVATYSDGSKKEIMDYKVANGEDLEVGQKSVLIHYTDGDREIEAIQLITVK